MNDLHSKDLSDDEAEIPLEYLLEAEDLQKIIVSFLNKKSMETPLTSIIKDGVALTETLVVPLWNKNLILRPAEN